MGIRLELIEDTFLFASKKNGSSVLKTCSLAFDVTKVGILESVDDSCYFLHCVSQGLCRPGIVFIRYSTSKWRNFIYTKLSSTTGNWWRIGRSSYDRRS
jgi:hypothetical protein